jgi:hypothetical protein
MIESILSLFGGIGSFVSYITDYFNDKGIRDRQKKYDSLLAKYNNLLDSIKAKEIDCESKLESLIIEYDAEISMLEHTIDSWGKEPDRTPRRIEG